MLTAILMATSSIKTFFYQVDVWENKSGKRVYLFYEVHIEGAPQQKKVLFKSIIPKHLRKNGLKKYKRLKRIKFRPIMQNYSGKQTNKTGSKRKRQYNPNKGNQRKKRK